MNPVTSFATLIVATAALGVIPAAADPFFFSTNGPDGLIATLSRTASAGKLESETADDFVTTAQTTFITNATFTGLLVGGAPQPMSKTSRLNFITCSRSIRPIR